MRVGVLTVSDSAWSGAAADRSGPLICALVVEHLGGSIVRQAVLPDERVLLEETLRQWCDSGGLDLLLTTGGTGFAPRDITPEATQAVLDRPAPGFAEAMRAASRRVTPHAMLSRAVSGIRQQTLIINLPGSPKAVRENLAEILPALPHAVELLQQGAGPGVYQHAQPGEHERDAAGRT